jgi:hypothetical protein
VAQASVVCDFCFVPGMEATLPQRSPNRPFVDICVKQRTVIGFRSMSPEDEDKTIEALIDLDSMEQQEDISCQVIADMCKCSPEEAKCALHDLVERKLIEAISDSGGAHRDDFPKWANARWKWRRR